MDLRYNIYVPYYGNKLIEVNGSPNGTFSLLIGDNEANETLTLFDAKGKIIAKNLPAVNAGILNDNSYFLGQTWEQAKKFKTCLFDPEFVITMYDAKGNVLSTNIEEYKIYANGWYMLCINDQKQLYRDDHTLMAKDFTQCEVFTNGYALRDNETFYKYADWKVYTPDGKYIGRCRNVERILGDGFFLCYNFEKKAYVLVDIKNEPQTDVNILEVQEYANGRFNLFRLYPEGKITSCLYNSDGTSFGEQDRCARYLPDGLFLMHNDDDTITIYNHDGSIKIDKVHQIITAGSYYFVNTGDKTTFYNDKSEALGDEYTLIKNEDNFVLVAYTKQNEKRPTNYCLFSQNDIAHVWS